jgi:four helix bundle protein
MLYFSFQKLEIYQLSKELVKDIYKLSSSFPSDEKYALVQQINRAAVSVVSNIAEGTSRNGSQEKIHFINVSYSSLMEIVCQTEIAFELGYLTKDAFENISKMAKN